MTSTATQIRTDDEHGDGDGGGDAGAKGPTICWITGSIGTGISEQSRVVVNALQERGISIARINSEPVGTGHEATYITDESGLIYPVESLSATVLDFDPDLVVFHNATANVRKAVTAVQPHAVTVARLGVNLREQLLAGDGYLGQLPDLIEFMQSVDHIIASSDRVTRTVRAHGVDLDRVTRIPTAIDASESNRLAPDAERPPARGANTNPETPTVGMIGRVGAIKNQFVAIEGLAGLRDCSPTEVGVEADLLIAGSTNGLDSLPQYLPKILPHFAPNFSTQMMGYVDDPMAEFYPHIDIHAHPSWTENCPQTVLEAAVAGVPTVVSDLAWADAYPELSDALLRCPPDDPWPWAETFYDLLSDDEYRFAIAQEQQTAVVEHYDIADIAPRYLDLFETLLDEYSAFKFSAEALTSR